MKFLLPVTLFSVVIFGMDFSFNKGFGLNKNGLKANDQAALDFTFNKGQNRLIKQNQKNEIPRITRQNCYPDIAFTLWKKDQQEKMDHKRNIKNIAAAEKTRKKKSENGRQFTKVLKPQELREKLKLEAIEQALIYNSEFALRKLFDGTFNLDINSDDWQRLTPSPEVTITDDAQEEQ